MNDNACYLTEIYSAIQGEGPLVGVRQIFVRFNICDLRCVWCDTPDSLVKTAYCSIEVSQGSREFIKIKNPVFTSDIASGILQLQPDLHHSISITGGEPLVQTKQLKFLLKELKKNIKLPIYLETGGHRWKEVAEVIEFVDYVSMDFKLPSSANAGNLWDEHKHFLEKVLSLKPAISIWIKIIVTAETLPIDVYKAIEIANNFNTQYKKNIEIFLQPVTQVNGTKPPNELELLKLQADMIQKYPYVRVIPQVHKLIGQR